LIFSYIVECIVNVILNISMSNDDPKTCISIKMYIFNIFITIRIPISVQCTRNRSIKRESRSLGRLRWAGRPEFSSRQGQELISLLPCLDLLWSKLLLRGKTAGAWSHLVLRLLMN
jgi:hypothetical protein